MNEPKILVAIRKRPLSKKEQSKGDTDIINCRNRETVIISEFKQKVDLTKYIEQTIFDFDFAFDENSTNQDIYVNAVRPLVCSAFQGAKVTCFAYGQTGSGKTFTMNGSSKMGVVGLYELGARDIFAFLADPQFQHLQAKLSYFEIYCGKLYDLLNKRKQLKIREDNKQNINIIDLEERQITEYKDFYDLMVRGGTQRITSENSANSQSSRSHAILQITLKEGKKVFGKISFIDLAGNQRGADHTDMKKQTRIDGAEINKSLLSLKECIRALDQGKGHTPFRGSKLTMVLKDSFVGFCRTFMIGNVSPSSASSQNTLNTLRYADRVKQLRRPNEGISKEELKARQMMLPRQNKNAIKIDINHDDDATDIEVKRQEAQRSYGLKTSRSRDVSKDLRKKSVNRSQSRSRQSSFTSGSPNHHIFSSNLRSSQLSSASKSKKQLIANNSVKMNITNERRSSQIGQKTPNKHNTSGKLPSFGPGSKNGSNLQLSRTNSMQIKAPKITLPEKIDVEQSHSPSRRNAPESLRQKFNNYTNKYGSPRNGDSRSSHLQNLNGEIAPEHEHYHNGINMHQSRHPPLAPKNIGIPDNWHDMVEFLNYVTDPELRRQCQQKINQTLLGEENALIKSHSDTLLNSLEVIKSQMSLINSLQSNRDAVTTREYISLLQDSIDEKVSLLEELKQKMVQFSYKLDSFQEMQQQRRHRLLGSNGHRGGDERLLEDLR